MGAPHVTVTIQNPAEPDRSWQELFLVDTGATDCLVPRPHLEAIGLKPEGQQTHGLANGAELKLDIAVGRIEFMGEFVAGTIIFRRGGRRAAPGRRRPGVGGHRSCPEHAAPQETARRPS